MGVIIRTTSFLALALVASSARADLIINVTGTLGGPTTLWEFTSTGTTTALADSVFQGNNSGNPKKMGDDRAWIGGDFTTLGGNTWTAGDFSGVDVLIGAASFEPDALYLATRNSGDAISLSLGGSDVGIQNGDSITWSGTVSLAIAFDDLNTGSFTTGGTLGGVPIQLNISAVPEPASGLWLLSAGILFWRRRS